ncbi:OmpA family protein [Flavobacterium enshiense]|uniref:Cell envelope biogenesis protein OmpA n=1 Tax=Flavobacterium enshiense DK69 TaxID=1107311 RepID=A0A0A2MVJ6_9FLAO|nr:OmpA family protein [Flavobacterium enshiense]KGO95621.1 cell envelope biogenesis protein OmpA [Flavobacterium enshiense DK69]
MKRIYIQIGLLLLMTTGYAQDKQSKKADQYFESYQYVNAIEEYLKLTDKDTATPYVAKQLGDCYYNINNATEAAKWYGKAVEAKADAETYFRYAQTLKTLGRYEEANKQMDAFAALMPSDSRAKEHKANPNYIPSLTKKDKMFDVSEIAISAKGSSDFGAVLTNDNTLYFASTRNAGKKKDKWANQPYLDIFQTTRNSDGTFSEPVAVKELNTPYHDGPVTVSKDGNVMFFARDGHSVGQFEKNKKSNTKIAQQGLYRAEKVNGKWTNITALPFNSPNYSVTNPSLSNDGKTLYFASNMPDGLGESDIWKVSIDGNTSGTPQNLGPAVNTAGKENFPFITENNVLYFASSGKQGFGGLDIFRMDLNKSEQPQNVGKPVNTEKDDFAFSYNKSANVGYFSSDRSGSDAIYAAKEVCKAEAIAAVTNKKTGAVLSNASVAILDTKGNVIETRQTDARGRVGYEVECETNYTFQVKADNFETATFPIDKIKSGQSVVEAQLMPVEVIVTETEVILNNVYFDYNKSNITPEGAGELDKLVKVMKDNPKMVIFVKSHTDSKGSASYNLKLSKQRAQSTVEYLISKGISRDRVSGKGFGSTEPKVDCGSNCTDEQHAQNRRSEFMIVKK